MRDWQNIAATDYDVVVIGGGINGAGTARDAALRGLRTIVIEKNDFASGTSSWSTRLVHGGLRYLEQFEFSLVRESLREREILLRNAPHLVHPLLLTVPIYGERSRPYWKVWAGMMLYDLFSYDKSVPIHRMVRGGALKQVARGLDGENLKGGAQYYDAQAEYAERLCLENIFAARDAGATVCNYVTVTGLERTGKRIHQVQCQDSLTGETFTVPLTAKGMVINTAGPWVDQVLERVRGEFVCDRQIGGTKGSHIIVDPFPGMPETAFYVEAKSDKRPFFIVPWLGRVLIGTTDLRFGGDLDRVKANTDEIDYLLNETNAILPTANLSRADIKFTYSGVRPLPYRQQSHSQKTGAFTRKHTLHDHSPEGVQNLVSLIGGKLTTYRHVGEEMVDWVYRKRGQTPPPCPTLSTPLPGCIQATDPRIQAATRQYASLLSRETVSHLFTLYGSGAQQVLALVDETMELAESISPHLPDIKAQIVYAVNQELAQTYLDITRRRTTLAMQDHYGFNALPILAEVLQKYCGWTEERCDRNRAEYYTFMRENCIPDFQLGAIEESLAIA
ncbi:MAG: glycerol-3-phosphate dehydrogenase [Cyanobacteria bacterium P01_G01_bin.54]